jgi:hypothetical protein
MQVVNGKIEVGIEGITSADLFLSNQTIGVSEMTKPTLSSNPDDYQEIPKPTDPRFTDMTGQTYNQLTAIKPVECRRREYHWLFRCDCGNLTKAVGAMVRSGHTKSCGCRRKSGTHTTHGMSHTPEHNTYRAAKTRCTNPNVPEFHHYGGRGIKFLFNCFEEFFAEVGKKPSPHHSLDRIDNNGHYEKGNVRWATKKEQGDNRRTNVVITYQGQTKNLKEWAEYLGIPYGRVNARNQSGFCQDCTLSTEIKIECRHNQRKRKPASGRVANP